jgi:hypothetical protein
MEKICYKCGLSVSGKDAWYGLHTSCFREAFDLPSLEKFQNLIAHRQSGEEIPNRVIHSSFFHGKFRKYSSTLGESKYILKVEEPDYPELPATEYLCNQIFQSLNINVPPFYLIQLEDKHVCFATKNFMQDEPRSNLVHIYHFFEEKMDYNCEHLLRIIGEKTGRQTAQEEFVYLTLADSLIGNNDRHGRNLGIIQTPSGYEMAPFYDNPSYLGTEIKSLLRADHKPAGAIRTQNAEHPSMKDYVQEWKRLNFGHVVDRFRSNVSWNEIQALIKSSYLTPARQEAVIRLISKRISEL